MSSEKFCLSWNDFKTNASQSFDLLRKENLFYDVTLVSEEQVNVKAHKAALSMCSNFFKNILKSNNHSHPWLFLGGISSKNIEYVMNYIYNGEVKLFQDEIDSFLDAAQKLQIDGLLSSNKAEDDQENINEGNHTNISGMDVYDQSYPQYSSPQVKEIKRFQESKKVALVAKNYTLDSNNQKEINQMVNNMIFKDNSGMITCNSCGKSSRDLGNMQRHAETHIEGISYTCNYAGCGKTFRSRNALNIHKTRFSHKN